ncbi:MULTISPECIES: hypothetical protein [Rhizobium/Agrobacterium group]|uniref:Transcriptional regulator n=1 Tax=Agrobacterium vitis TaxID=373 RepID=A0ABD6H7U1_AGRVI|nr:MULTISPECIES: hypothetical protein [Rhizobium/Agrobacterium group]MUO29459.1 hypothetical protein [Agrobacterium vitis]MUO42634.1 hypothetical protein [Agrobacterium vitis]MUP10603.1 hypothetical protein [Agrobacterium vitis]
MGKASNQRYKARKQANKKAAITFDNATPSQMAALLAEREQLIANAEKRLPKHKAALYARPKGGEGRNK